MGHTSTSFDGSDICSKQNTTIGFSYFFRILSTWWRSTHVLRIASPWRYFSGRAAGLPWLRAWPPTRSTCSWTRWRASGPVWTKRWPRSWRTLLSKLLVFCELLYAVCRHGVFLLPYGLLQGWLHWILAVSCQVLGSRWTFVTLIITS